MEKMTNKELVERYDMPYPPRAALEEGFWRFVAYFGKGIIPESDTYADVEPYLLEGGEPQ
jgi:hypothetical protein